MGALSNPWLGPLAHAFLLLPILAKVLRKAKEDQATLLLLPRSGQLNPGSRNCCVSPLPLLSRSAFTPEPSSSLSQESHRPARVSQPSRLASVRHSQRASQGMASQTHRSGTQGIYSSHSSHWLQWPHDNQADPCNPSRIQVANFLAALYTDLSLSASSVKVYSAAIYTTLGSPSFSDDPSLGTRFFLRQSGMQETLGLLQHGTFLWFSLLCVFPHTN